MPAKSNTAPPAPTRPAPRRPAPAIDEKYNDDLDELDAMIARDRALNAKDGGRKWKPLVAMPAPVTIAEPFAADFNDADLDELDAMIARDRALNAGRKRKPPVIAEPLEEKDEPLEHKDAAAPDEPLHWRVLRTYRNAQQMRLRDSRMDVPEGHPSAADPRAIAELVEPLTVQRLTEDARELGGMKAHLGMTIQITKETHNGDGSTSYETQEISRWGSMRTLLVGTSDDVLAGFISESLTEVIEAVEKFVQGGSGHGIDR